MDKKQRLITHLKRYDSLVVAFSGGVDSSFLLAAAQRVLNGNVVAVTAVSAVHSMKERQAAIDFAKELGVKHILIETEEMGHSEFVKNPFDKCYICKKIKFTAIIQTAHDLNIMHIAHGANLDDLDDFRPGIKATRELNIVAPLIDAELTKADIRYLAKRMNLSVWNKPAMACLASRIPYGTKITPQALNMIESAEKAVLDAGFTSCRVRHHGSVARIELDQKELTKMLDEDARKDILYALEQIGFLYVTLDLKGYVQGSMNRLIGK